MALFLRSIVIAVAFLISCLVAAFVVAYGLVAPDLPQNADGGAGYFLLILFFAGAAGLVTPFYVFAPAFVAILIAEMFSLRSVIYYALGGAVIGALAYFMTDASAHLQGKGAVMPITDELQWLAAAGIIAGFVFWAIAGRGAGKWKMMP
ncbi:MAG: hypothetical protein KF748_09885 [Xanthobacteraceae bacterium]|nr:hypothetical protein [Xanthobacteraceae bacterium]MBX3549457.1 hypothetical protein [Xanthobacteraceae bacterium]